MKRFLYACGVAVCALPLLIACGDGDFETITLSKEASYAIAEGHSDSLSVSISVQYPVSGMSKEASENMSMLLTDIIFGEKYAGMPPEEVVDNYMADKAAEYRASNADLIGEVFSLNYGEMIDASVVSVCEGIVSYFVLHYTYSGGAHGMTMENAYNFDIKTGEPVMEEDIFKIGSEATLSALLQKHLPEAFEDPEYIESLFVTELYPNGNFSLSEDGVTYIYNRYEIGPYALGAIRVTIPWAELKDILK